MNDNNVHGKIQVKRCAAVADETKNDTIKHGGFSPAQWVLGKASCGVGHLLDEDERAQPGILESLHDPAGEFSLQRTCRLTSRKAFVKEDCRKRASRALLRKAAPSPGNYSAGDLVCFRRERGSKEPGSN